MDVPLPVITALTAQNTDADHALLDGTVKRTHTHTPPKDCPVGLWEDGRAMDSALVSLHWFDL